MYVELATEMGNTAVNLANLTLVTGVGKSLFLEMLYKTMNVGGKIPKFGGRWKLRIQNGGVSYTISQDKRRVRQSIVVRGEEIVFEYVPGKFHKLIKPVNLSISNADVIIPEVEVQSHVSIIASEELEKLNNLLRVARRSLEFDVKFLGPYLAPKSLVSATASPTIDKYGRNLAIVLAYLALYRPAVYDTLRSRMRELGFTLSVGLAKPGKLGVLLHMKTKRLTLAKAPCSVKKFLTLSTVLELKPDIVLIDNFDFCLTRRVAKALSTQLSQSNSIVVAEIHNPDVIEWLDVPSKTVVEVSL